ncbi:restriction endonuclease subunit S [Metabacillus litoralis]|nr:restriction endonuclease subunit S [Metabacillus litoralis]
MADLGSFNKTYSFSRNVEGEGEYHHIHYGDIHSTYRGIINEQTDVPSITEEGPFECIEDGEIIFADASEDYNDLGKAVAVWGLESKKVISGLHTHRFKPNNELDTRFLFYFTQSSPYRRFVREQGTGISVLGISKSNLAKLELPLPSMEEQKRISAFFFLLDQKIEKQKEKIEQFEMFKKDMMEKIFKQEIRFKDKVGKFYSEWENVTLGNVSISLDYGLNAAATKYDGENKYIRITDIDDQTRRYIEENKVSPEGNLTDNYLVKRGDILFARTGASTGKSFLYENSDGKMYFAGFLIRARIKPNVDYKFVYYQTLTTSYQRWVKVMSMRSGQPGINATEYASFVFSLPSIEEQRKISIFLSKIEDKIGAEREKLKALIQQKKGYLQQMFV